MTYKPDEIATLSAIFDKLVEDVYKVNRAKGWFEDSRTFGDLIALLHSEVSELLEEYRNNNRAKMSLEVADVFIRLLDLCFREGINLGESYCLKYNYNENRPYRHGNKRL